MAPQQAGDTIFVVTRRALGECSPHPEMQVIPFGAGYFAPRRHWPTVKAHIHSPCFPPPSVGGRVVCDVLGSFPAGNHVIFPVISFASRRLVCRAPLCVQLVVCGGALLICATCITQSRGYLIAVAPSGLWTSWYRRWLCVQPTCVGCMSGLGIVYLLRRCV